MNTTGRDLLAMVGLFAVFWVGIVAAVTVVAYVVRGAAWLVGAEELLVATGITITVYLAWIFLDNGRLISWNRLRR